MGGCVLKGLLCASMFPVKMFGKPTRSTKFDASGHLESRDELFFRRSQWDVGF